MSTVCSKQHCSSNTSTTGGVDGDSNNVSRSFQILREPVMEGSLLVAARKKGRIQEVAMNEVRLLLFQSTGKCCIGTSGLNGCTAVIIVSPSAAILAHIPPRPNMDMTNDEAGNQNVQARMSEVATLFHQYKSYFPPTKTTWVVSALYEGKIALPEQKAIIEKSLRQMGTRFANVTYVVSKPGQPRRPAHGTVFVEFRGGTPLVYVEDRLINQTWGSSQGSTSGEAK